MAVSPRPKAPALACDLIARGWALPQL